MRKHLLCLIALLAVCTAGNAQVFGLNVGYCNGNLVTATNQSFGTKDKDTWVSGAIYLPAADVNVYQGNYIDSIRVGLAQKLGIDSLVVWVRNELDGQNLAEGLMLKKDLQRGWNTVKLDQAYQFDGNNTTGLYIGYSTHQTSSNYGMSVLLNPLPNALFTKLGTDAAWEDRSDEGILCIEAMVLGDNLPKLNLKLLSLSSPTDFVIAKGVMTVTGVVQNIALQTVTGFDVETRFDGIDDVYTSHVDLSIGYQDESEFSFTLSPAITQTGTEHITVTITRLDEGDDENLADNVASRTFDVVEQDFTRHVLLEEFTTESCPNCPRVGNYLHNILENEYYAENVVAVCHHSAYYTDWLTIPSDNDYTWYFNDGGATYAPAIMVDRRTSTGSSTPVFNPTSENQLKQYIDLCLSKPAFVSLNITAETDTATNIVDVTVTGSRSKESFTENPPRITVWLVEDNITARSQAGANSGWIHYHVNRSVNSSWGEEIVWDGDDYAYTCKLNLRNDYVRENLSVAAMIYDYDNTDARYNTVANAASQPVYTPTEDGINDITMQIESADVYDLQGRKVSKDKLSHGIYVSNGKKYLVK